MTGINLVCTKYWSSVAERSLFQGHLVYTTVHMNNLFLQLMVSENGAQFYTVCNQSTCLKKHSLYKNIVLAAGSKSNMQKLPSLQYLGT